MAAHVPIGNQLIDRLPPRSQRALVSRAQQVALVSSELLFRQAEPITAVHFPLTAVASLVTYLQDGSAIELSTVGNEGMTGAAVVLGARAMPNASCECQIPGDALAVPVTDFVDQVARDAGLRDLCLRYVAVLLTSVGQSVACSRLHTTPERCARWLLRTHDRVGHDSIPLTHELLAFILGSRRASVTEAIGDLQRAGLVRSHRGTIEIVDRAGLERAACECYAVVTGAIADMLR